MLLAFIYLPYTDFRIEPTHNQNLPLLPPINISSPRICMESSPRFPPILSLSLSLSRRDRAWQ